MLLFLLLVGLVCQVWGGPLGKQKTTEIKYEEGYINSLSENPQLPEIGEIALDNMEDDAVREGDILIPSDRNAVNDLWPEVDGKVSVPYEIDFLLEDRTEAITEALEMISDQTCVTFHQRTFETDYIIFSHGQWCESYVGCKGGEQRIVVGQKCRVGNICHEVLHALGLYHEHSRIDREEYITILSENIAPGMEDSFLAKDGNTLGIMYDLGSIMHYGPKFFSRNGEDTIVAKDSSVTIGQRSHLSELDVLRIRRLYQCDV